MSGSQRGKPPLSAAGPNRVRPPYAAVIFDMDAVLPAQVRPGARALLQRLHESQIPTGLVTTRRNAEALLGAAGIGDRFDVVVDGTPAKELGLTDQQVPAMLLEVAARLGLRPAEAAVVGDAIATVQAGQREGFGLVVGIARQLDQEPLRSAGADLVVEDLSQLDLGALRADPWILSYEGFDPAHEGHREALTALSNGYMGTRGAMPEHRADGVHYPGTYVAGVYNRVTSLVEGTALEEEHLVNVPDWLPLDLRIENGEWWSAGGLHSDHERTDLDLRRGILVRTARLTDSAGRVLRLTQQRLVSMARPHVAVLATSIVADGWTGRVSVRSGIDTSVTNSNVAALSSLNNRHLTAIAATQVDSAHLLVEAETTASGVKVATAVRTTVFGGRADLPRQVEPRSGLYAQELSLELAVGRPVVIEKTAAIVTSRDAAIASPADGAVMELRRAPARFEDLRTENEAAWTQLWNRFQVRVDGLFGQDQLVLNLHLFHLMQTLTRHTAQLDAGVPARGLHGEGYRGHVFWDELFVLPILTTQAPAVARAILEYRWRRLPAARQAASELGLAGAIFPWQSGSDGREETPKRLFNARSGRWMADNSWRQRHVGLAVAYNAWQYYLATGDVAWLAERGGELIIEVARSFSAMASYDAATDRFHIEGVMGPDEYHDGYPDAPGAGLRDNAYTNVMTAWVCSRALEVMHVLRGEACDELMSTLRVAPGERDRWERLSRRLTVPFHDGMISQFDGYHGLEEFDWPRYRSTYGNIGRLDLILEAEGDSTNRYKLAKQADVLMLVYLFGVDGLIGLLGQLGYEMAESDLSRAVDYYLARTAHGSTLSRVAHASTLAQFDGERAWAVFREALIADLDDTQGGTTNEGVHLGAMAGTIDILRRAFAGMRMTETGLAFTPRLPRQIEAISFWVHCQGHHLEVLVEQDGVRLTSHDCETVRPLRVKVGETTADLEPGAHHRFPGAAGEEAP